MEKLVFKYTYCSEPECWDWNVPFEWESKESFVFEVLRNPKILEELGIVSVWDYTVEDGTIYEEDYIKNCNQFIFTLDEWFEKSKVTQVKS
jgi:hypothetical protein